MSSVPEIPNRSFAEIDHAIERYAESENPGDIVTGWVLIASAAVTSQPDTVSYHFVESSQPVHITAGLVHMAQINVDQIINDTPIDELQVSLEATLELAKKLAKAIRAKKSDDNDMPVG